MAKGTFTPTETAKKLSKAPHFNNDSTPIVARFSSSTGIPTLPDTVPDGNPRGFAIRFKLPSRKDGYRVHTDIITHSTPFFPTHTGEEFLQFFQAVGAGNVPDFLGSHPAALAFVQAPKPTPSSLAREKYFGVTAYKFVSADHKETYVRYQIVPEAGEDHLDENALKEKGPNFLYDGVKSLIGEAGPIRFKLCAQIAEKGDKTDDATVHWPEERKVVQLGTIELNGLVEHDAEEQRKIIFDPIPRVPGVETSDDPLLDMRAGVYLISGRERRAAGGT
jgi:catalase